MPSKNVTAGARKSVLNGVNVADRVVAVFLPCTVALLSSRRGIVLYRTLPEVKLLRNDMPFLCSAKAGRPLVVLRYRGSPNSKRFATVM